jgi:hypothetical protein
MRRSGGRSFGTGGPVLGLTLAGLVLLAACTGASPGDRRSVAPGAGGCPVASGDGGWRRLAVLAGSGAETSAEVTGVAARSAGEPWVAVGAVRSGGPPPSIGTPVSGAEGQSGTTVPASGTGPAGGSAAGGTLAPAVWTSPDGAQWTRAKVEPVTLDGAVDHLLGVARWGSTAAAVGVAFNHNEGVARPSAWASRAGGPWREAPANRELFGGPAGQGVTGVGAGALGLAVLGPRTGADNRTFVAVWRSRDGRLWLPPQQAPALTADPTEPVVPLSVAVGSRAIVVTGKVVRVNDPGDGAIWTGTPPGAAAADATGDLRWERVAAGPAGLGGAGVQEVDRVVAFGSGFAAAGLAGEPGRLRLVSWTSPDGVAWRRWPAGPTPGVDRLTSLQASDGGLLAAAVAGSTACLWRSSDGKVWTPEPLPTAAARPKGLQRALAASDGARTLLIVQGEGRAEVWSERSGGG